MAGEWKIDRHFDYESVNYYYTNKIKAFPTSDIPTLPTVAFDSVKALGAHCFEVASSLGLALPKCNLEDMYLWGFYLSNLPADKQSNAWKFREYVFGTAMIFIGQYISAAQAVRPPRDTIVILEGYTRPLLKEFKIENHSFTIVGSSELTSDIDITIQGPYSSFLICLIEDLFLALTVQENIPIRCWDVEFYGDFHVLQSMFMNFKKFSNAQRAVLLKYALVSYFRSSHQIENVPPSISPSVEFLVKHCLKLIDSTGDINKLYGELVDNAYMYWRTTAPMGKLDRELFYRSLFSVESDSAFIKPYLLKGEGGVTSDNAKIGEAGKAADNLAFLMFSTMAQANIHRAESYVLPSTAIHVVEFEQKRVGKSTLGLPDTWFASNARIGIDPFGFILSAVEQLGYLEHYHPRGLACNKKGIKYFGRYVRALVQSGLLPETSPYTGIYQHLNTYRSSKDADARCGHNVHTLLSDILRQMGGASGGKRRKTRRIRRAARK